MHRRAFRIFTLGTPDVVYALKEKSPRLLKILRTQPLLSCHFCVSLLCAVLVRRGSQNEPKFDFASWPTEHGFHLDSLPPISLRPHAFPHLTPASCMPRSFFFIGKKREMFEHPVFCLASQVMDLTIREYLDHPLPTLSHHLIAPPASLTSRRVVALAMLVSYLCLFVCESEWGERRLGDLSGAALGPFFAVSAICL